jgi:hypothetical protein
MQDIQRLPVHLSAADGRRQAGELELRVWSPAERRGRAIRAWGICWAIMVCSVFIPLAHFVLVPGFFLAGPIVAWFVSRVPNAVTGGEARCPSCGEPFEFARRSLKWPLRDVCGRCHTEVSISEARG